MPEFYVTFVRKINKIPEFYMIFARKCTNFTLCPPPCHLLRLLPLTFFSVARMNIFEYDKYICIR